MLLIRGLCFYQMNYNTSRPLKKLAESPVSFFIPKHQNLKVSKEFLDKKIVAAIIPTYKPKMITYRLIKNMTKWYPDMMIVVVDDSTPSSCKNFKIIKKIKQLARLNTRVTYLRTPVNRLKAGALNYGFDYVSIALEQKPHIVITLDDDVILTRKTIRAMIKSLYSEVTMGAVCTLAKVKNKNVNLLTRLQAFEYHNFNITKISDNGFLKGPLVMPGMLTAFRYAAIREASGFTTGHLIEDYDLTAKLKSKGWQVSIAKDTEAWTMVPEDLGSLWKQRVRWVYGGLTVLRNYWKNIPTVFQDLFGHFLFISLFTLVIFSFIFARSYNGNPTLILLLLILSVINFLAANAFNLLTFLTYSQKDRVDWIIKLSLIPEFIYSNFLTLVLLGTYLFFVYNKLLGTLSRKVNFILKIYKVGLVFFGKAGYSLSWGTRQSL